MKILIPLISLCLFSSMSWSNCIGDCVNGKGTSTWPNGQKYVGQYKDGKYHGQGTYTWPDGQKYVGDWKYDDRNGQGTQTYTNGQKYVGDWKDSKKHGQGTYTWPSGQKYVGDWKDGKKHGQGTQTGANGHKYVGDWKDDKKHGQGTITYSYGSKKSGIWQKDVYVGTIVEFEKAEKERITAEKMRQRVKQEARDKYDRIYNACLLDKGASADLQVSSLERALKNVCDGIAKDPSWLENMKYD